MARSELLLLVIIVNFACSALPGCENAGCLGTLTQADCPPGTTLAQNVTLGGCCPGCIQFAGLEDDCTDLPCMPGLVCSTSKKCALVNDDPNSKCKSYDFRDFAWKPTCDIEGMYAAKQCKGERLTGRCFCYSEVGKRIFGQSWWSRAENMTCECSRRVEALRALGRKDVTIHCTEDGNFEPLQCDNGVCWCAEEKYGDALGEVVPAPMMKLLPCYNSTIMGPTYLRVCDSANSALYQIRDEMTKHGTEGDAFLEKQCGLDGSYGAFVFENGQSYCTWRDNSKIGSFQSQLPSSQIDCYCARDTKYYSLEGYTFTMQCQGSGSYYTDQLINDEKICVDPDGFRYADKEENKDCPPLP